MLLADKQKSLATALSELTLASGNYAGAVTQAAMAQTITATPAQVDLKVNTQVVDDDVSLAETMEKDADREVGAALAELQAILGIPVSGTAPPSP